MSAARSRWSALVIAVGSPAKASVRDDSGVRLVASEDDLGGRDAAVSRTLLAGVSLAIVVCACSGPMTPADYVDVLNAQVATARSDLEASVAAYGQIAEPTMAESVAFVEREIAIRREFLEGFEALDPPESLADVHRVLGDALVRLLAAAEGLVAVADSVSSVDEAEQTPEFAEYEAANADGRTVCLDVQALLDDLVASGEAFRDTPWIPEDVGLAVQGVLGCGEIETA